MAAALEGVDAAWRPPPQTHTNKSSRPPAMTTMVMPATTPPLLPSMDISTPTSLLPAVRASGKCPPLLIRDETIIEGGVFEMALLRALDRSRSSLGEWRRYIGDGGRFGPYRCWMLLARLYGCWSLSPSIPNRNRNIFNTNNSSSFLHFLFVGLILSVEPGAAENFTSAMKVSCGLPSATSCLLCVWLLIDVCVRGYV